MCPPGPQRLPCRAPPAAASIIADFSLHPEFGGVPPVSSLSGSCSMAPALCMLADLSRSQRFMPAVGNLHGCARLCAVPRHGDPSAWSCISGGNRPRLEHHEPCKAGGFTGQSRPVCAHGAQQSPGRGCSLGERVHEHWRLGAAAGPSRPARAQAVQGSAGREASGAQWAAALLIPSPCGPPRPVTHARPHRVTGARGGGRQPGTQ